MKRNVFILLIFIRTSKVKIDQDPAADWSQTNRRYQVRITLLAVGVA